MENKQMNPVEKKEIRGLSIKTIYWLMATTAVVVFTVLATYFSILERLTKIEIGNSANEKYNDLKIQTIDLKIQSLEVQIKEIKNRLDANQK